MRLLLTASVLLPVLAAFADDWPMFRGPEVNGVSKEVGLNAAWPSDGPKVSWRAKVGLGFSAVVVSGRSLVTTGHDGRAKGKDTVWCLDTGTGQPLWQRAYNADLKSTRLNSSH